MAELKEAIISVSCLIIAVISIVGNSLVCHVILNVKSMKTSMNWLLFNLSLIDAITGFMAIFGVVLADNSSLFSVEEALGKLQNRSVLTGEILCKVQTSFWGSSSISPLLLVIIAYERYKAVVHPLSRIDSGITKTKLKWIIPLSWLWGLGFLINDFVLVKFIDGACEMQAYSGFNHLAFTFTFVILQFVIPATIITVLYSRVIYSLRNASTPGVQAQVQRARNREKRKVIIVVIIVTLTFFIFCGIPNVCYVLDHLFGLSFWMTFGDFPVLAITLNSAVNPFVYFIFIKSFQNALKTVCGCSTGSIGDQSFRSIVLRREITERQEVDGPTLASEPRLLSLKITAK